MRSIFLVDAAPGFEDGVESSLKVLKEVLAVTRHKSGNHDFAVLVETTDAAHERRLLTSTLQLMTGVKAVERMDSPSADLKDRLERAATTA